MSTDTFSQRKIIHIDLDAFFASVEQRDNPDLKGKPVLVGGRPEQRGVVAAASYEARHFGIHSAMPMKTAVRLCPDAIILPARKSHYQQVSKQIREIFFRFTDLVEPVALDECFLDVTQNKPGIPYATEVAKTIKAQILEDLSLTASAGVAPNKFLAKIASDMDKPDGLYVIRPHEVEGFLRDLPVSKLWGVGPVTEKQLDNLGIRTIGQLRDQPKELLVRKFGKVGVNFYNLARGIDERPVDAEGKRKSISREITFPTDLLVVEQMVEELRGLSEGVAKDLGAGGLKGRTITLKVRYPDLKIQTRSQTLPVGVDDKERIFQTALELLEKTETEQGVRLLGIGLSHWEEYDSLQLQLF